MSSKQDKVPVSRRALIARIQRALKKEGQILKASRGARGIQECGEYYILSERNLILHKDVDLESLGEELEVLKPYEKMIEDD